MNVECEIRALVETHLAVNQSFDGVGFIDRLLPLASEVGEIKCTLASDRHLRFQVPEHPPWEVELQRAKAKLRLLCARLSVLCAESGSLQGGLYGGEGFIENPVPAGAPLHVLQPSSAAIPAGASSTERSLARPETGNSHAPVRKWKVRFDNTMHRQEFTIGIP